MMIERNIPQNNGELKRVFVPMTDIFETPDMYSLKLEMPGTTREDIDIVIDENELQITGKTTGFNDSENLKFTEFKTRDYYRVFRIGNDIDRTNIEANYQNGILSLKLNKSEEVKPRKIMINTVK